MKEHPGELVSLVWNDFVGLSRTRSVPLAKYENCRQHGLGWAVAGQSLTPFEDIADNPWGPMGEVRQIPVESTRRRVAISAQHSPLHFVLCDSRNVDGTPWECCTRNTLSSALDALKRETGLETRIAYENEFLLLGDDLQWAPPFSLEALRRIAPFTDRCVEALMNADVGLETFEPEFGVGQFEISCAPADGIAGADRVIITREVVREVARQLDLRASFTPKPTPDGVGNGCHLHISFWDPSGAPMTFDPDGHGMLTETAARFVAGVQAALPGLSAMTAPSPVSYARFGPHHWSCGFNAVGVHNREAAIRICPSPDTDPATRANAFNIEFRFTDATASPYLAIAAILRAGLSGIRNELPPPALADRDPADMTDAEREALGLTELPGSLDSALDAFARDPSYGDWLSPTFLKAYIDLKRLESEMFNNDTDGMFKRYREAY